jgi:hypothetical protein
MALHKDDLMVVQKHDGANEIRKATIEQLSDFLQTSDTVVYQGVANFTINGEEPGTKSTGDLYINSALIDGTWAWSANSGSITDVKPGDRCIWNGTQWDVITSGVDDSGVTEVTGSLPIEIENGQSASPNVTVKDATDSTTGVVKLASAAEITAGVSETSVVTVKQLEDGLGNVTVPDATTDVKGIVELADSDDLTAGATDKVVTADQLKVVDDKVDGALSGGIVSLVPQDPITVNTTDNGATTNSPHVGIEDAATGQKGAIAIQELGVAPATADDVAVTPEYVGTYYVPVDFSSLTDITDGDPLP